MTKKKRWSLSSCAIDLIMIIFSLFRIVPDFICLIEKEAHLVKKSVVHILLLYLIAGTLLTAIWLCILGIFLLYFISLKLSPLLSMFIILTINILLLIITGLLIAKSKNNLSFKNTCDLIRNFHIK